jgi:adenine-specific DNA-methyltransferase
VERCLLFASDPGDLILDPTCGSGTTAFVAEQWGRRWITIDTSRVAVTLARSRLMGARYPFYALKDSETGAIVDEECKLNRKLSSEEINTVRARASFTSDVSHGFVYERTPHVMLKSIANNAEIDVIWDKFRPILERYREQLNKAAGIKWSEWQIPRTPIYPWADKPTKLHAKIQDLLEERQELATNWERGTDEIDETDIQKNDKKIAKALKELNSALGRSYRLDNFPPHAGDGLPIEAVPLHEAWWKARLERQAEIDVSIAKNAEVEYLVDRPLVVKKVVRVAGPFTVDSLSPHRVLAGRRPADFQDSPGRPPCRPSGR